MCFQISIGYRGRRDAKYCVFTIDIVMPGRGDVETQNIASVQSTPCCRGGVRRDAKYCVCTITP